MHCKILQVTISAVFAGAVCKLFVKILQGPLIVNINIFQ